MHEKFQRVHQDSSRLAEFEFHRPINIQSHGIMRLGIMRIGINSLFYPAGFILICHN